MSKDHAIDRVLHELATRPAETWRTALTERVGDPAAVAQAMLWLRAEQARDDRDPPVLDPDGAERYELVMRLDTGATASVWRAHDRKLGRDVALKVFRLGCDAARVVAEARAACDIASPFVVRVLDVHEGVPAYIVMELIGEHAPDRTQLVHGAAASVVVPRDAREVATWLMHVARGVHDAHVRGVFHLDLKPRNVLIAPMSRRAWVADFGLAATAHAGPSRHIGGTPEYMAPEQARGLHTADRATLVAIDVWGLGALGYALLAGRPPWQPTEDVEAWELAVSGCRPPELAWSRWGSRIPRALRHIVETCLASEPRLRYRGADEVAHDLEAYLAGRPPAVERSSIIRAALWARRNVALVASVVAATGFAVALAETSVTTSVVPRATPARLQPHHIVEPVDTPRVTEAPTTRGGRAQPRTTLPRRDAGRSPRVPDPRPVARSTPAPGEMRAESFVDDRRPDPPQQDPHAAILRAERDEAIAERDRVREELARALDRLETATATAAPTECPTEPSGVEPTSETTADLPGLPSESVRAATDLDL